MFQQKRLAVLAGTAAMVAMLSACGTPPNTYGANNYPTAAVASYPATNPGYIEFGRVSNIEVIQTTNTMGASGSGNSNAGTVIGGVVGAVLGNTIGHGGGRAAATVLGAVGGAVVGNKLARNQDGSYNSATVYRVSVQTENGEWRSYDVSSTGDLRVGDRVRIENNVLYRS